METPFQQIATATLPDFPILVSIVLLFIPLLSFVVLYFFGHKLPRKGDIYSALFIGVAFICSCWLFFNVYTSANFYYSFAWFSIDSITEPIQFTMSIMLDKVSVLMLVIVTFISLLVHLYSIEYMEGKRNYLRYFPYLALFTFSMLGIVLSDNLLVTFMFWELVGFSSYLLIGFWFEKDSASKAAKKAFLYNRVGDWGFISGLLILWMHYGTLELSLIDLMQTEAPSGFWLNLAGLGILGGVMGKSAQFPLMAWLPDAMEGPTPVSALIHAATMVAAGIYLLFKVFFLLTPPVLNLIVLIGAFTALLGAIAALMQYDIKKVLAFSTVSQLGYMVMAVGTGAYDAALFHLLTHAFFKACLFLAAGAVIHEMYHIKKHLFLDRHFYDFSTLDMRMMGALRSKMPVTFAAYCIAALSLTGIPFFSGFLSKDAILLYTLSWSANQQSLIAYLVPVSALLTVFLTAFYMARQIFLIFFGEFRLGQQFSPASKVFDNYAQDPGKLMTIPMAILAALSLFPFFSANPFSISDVWFLKNFTTATPVPSSGLIPYLVPALSVILALAGIYISWLLFRRKDVFSTENSMLFSISANNLYQDLLVKNYIERPVMHIAENLNYLDRKIIDRSLHTIIRFQLYLANIVSIVDKKIVDNIVHAIAISQVIIGHIAAFADTYIVDGFIHLLTYCAAKTANIARSWQTGGIQRYIVYLSVVVLLFLFIVIV